MEKSYANIHICFLHLLFNSNCYCECIDREKKKGIFQANGPRTHHFSTGNMQQIWGMIAGGQGLRLQSAGILQLLDCGELGLVVAGLRDAEAWREQMENNH